MRRSGVRIPLAPPQADIRSRMSVFCMPGRVGVVPVVVLLVVPLVFRALRCDALWGPAAVCAGGRRPAREIATREPAARSGRSRGPPWPCRHPPAPRLGPVTAHGHHSLTPPPTGTAAGPHRRPRAPQPGPTAAHGHRSLAPLPPPVRPCPPVPPAPSTADCCRSPVGPATHVKPSLPLLACALPPVKPTTPLQVRYTCFWCYFIEQRRRGFHGDVPMSPHWCRRFHLAVR